MEFNNLADDQKYFEIKQKLYTILVDSLKQFEKNMIPEKPETIEKAKQSSAASFKSKMGKLGLSNQSTDEEIIKYWENKFSKK